VHFACRDQKSNSIFWEVGDGRWDDFDLGWFRKVVEKLFGIGCGYINIMLRSALSCIRCIYK